MAEQDGDRLVAFRGGIEGAVAGLTGGAFGPQMFVIHRHRDDVDRVQFQLPQHVGGRRGNLGAAILQAMVDDDGSRGYASPSGEEGRHRGQRERVRTTAAGHQHERCFGSVFRGFPVRP